MMEPAATELGTGRSLMPAPAPATRDNATRNVLGSALSLILLVGQMTICLSAVATAPKAISNGVAGTDSRPLNLVVVLDLSDRINPAKNPGQAEQDLKLLDGLITLFEEKVRKGLYLLSRDRLVFAVAPQSTTYQRELLTVADSLRINMPELNGGRAERGKPGFDKARAGLTEGLSRLYGRAAASEKYVGADIWSFFRDRLDSYVSSEPGVRNVVVVVTDGYINFEREEERGRPRKGSRTSYMRVAELRSDSNWERRFDRDNWGLISFGARYREVEVAVAGLRYVQLADQPIVERYWTGWLGEMGVARVKLLAADDSVVPSMGILKRLLS